MMMLHDFAVAYTDWGWIVALVIGSAIGFAAGKSDSLCGDLVFLGAMLTLMVLDCVAVLAK
jgi:hypothetical protein